MEVDLGRWIQTEPLDLGALLAEASDPASGAVVVFCGRVRDHNEGRRVRSLAYDAHVAIAERVLRDLEGEVVARFGVRCCRIQHRVGPLALEEPSVYIVVASPHREEAFAAAVYAIDTLKARAPIWKEERYDDGDSRFVEGVPLAPPGRSEP